MKIEDPILSRMQQFLDFASRKQQVTASNLANLETPGYKARELDFQDFLQGALDGSGAAMKATHPRHVGSRPRLIREPSVRESATDALGRDGNNVDLDKEMTELARTVLEFSVVSQLFQQKVRIVETSLREGRS